MPDERHRRLALNESRFREINDRLAEALEDLRHPPEHIDFVCECAHLECRMQITLSREEYEHIRSDPQVFAVAEGHQIPDAEDVVERNERFLTIRKHDDVQELTSATDPRA